MQATSDDPNLAVHAVKERTGDLALLVINKSPSGPITRQFSLAGTAARPGPVQQYGEAQDTAQSQSSTGQSALANFTATLSSGSTFNYAFPAYSMSVVELSPALGSAPLGPRITSPAAPTVNPVVGTSVGLSVSATDPAGASSLTYTWSTMPSSPAGVVFSVNGTNAAAQTTATFSQAGTYVFQVIVADPGGKAAVSQVTVTVAPPIQGAGLSATIHYAANANWRTGFVGDVMILCTGTAISGWSMQFNFASKITSIWGASVVKHSGSRYTIKSDAYDAMIAPGQSVTFDLGASPAGPRRTGRHRSQWRLAATFPACRPVDRRGEVRGHPSSPGAEPKRRSPSQTWGRSQSAAGRKQFNYSPRITSVSGAAIVRHVGPVYVFRDAGYDGVIAPGASVSFRFKSSQQKLRSGPVKYSLDGIPISAS